jgi:hypothetical protein
MYHHDLQREKIMKTLNESEIKDMKEKASIEVSRILDRLEKDHPGITEGLAASLGAAIGAGGSLAALSALGVTGLSAVGISTGLATAGALVGGGMVAGIGVLAAPVAILAVVGFTIAKKIKSARLAASLGKAISGLYDIQTQLIENAEYFKDEISGIKTTIELLKRKNTHKG